MTRQDAVGLLERTLDLPPHSLAGPERLADLEAWDSLSTVAFIAEVDRRLGLALPGGRVAACRTVDELAELLCGSLQRAA
jgi:acyl carrier protein